MTATTDTSAPTTHQGILAWVDEIAELTQPDAVYVNAANTIKSPGYQIVDAMATYPLTNQLSLRLNVYNVTNETYIRNINNNAGRYNPGTPRSFLLSTAVRF